MRVEKLLFELSVTVVNIHPKAESTIVLNKL